MEKEKRQNHLLVVESNKAECAGLIGYLEQEEYQVSVVKGSKQAWEKLLDCKDAQTQAPGIDLVLLATQIQNMESSRLIERIKADPALSLIPVIMMAQSAEKDEIVEWFKLGADDCLRAPFVPELLKLRIGFCLERKQLKSQESHQKGLLKLELDMQIARQIQHDFLPKELPQPEGWEIGACFEPARQVGGDFYDVFPLAGDRIGLVIADVCDKGVGAALFMALSRSLIRAFADQHRPLGWMGNLSDGASLSALKQGDSKRRRLLLSAGTGALIAVELTNNYIANNHGETGMFATLFFGVLDPGTGVLTYVNGGHDAPAIVNEDGIVKERLMPTGPAVGAMPDMFYDVRQTTISPGDLFIGFTDGVTDALNPAGERFTDERLFSLLPQSSPSVPALLDRIGATLHTYIAEADQFDDITMLVARRALHRKEKQ